MDWRTLCEGVDLIKDVTELQIKFIFGDISDMGGRQHVGMGEQGMILIPQGFCVEHVNGSVNSVFGDFRFQSTGVYQTGP